jgi:DHA1 family multidrug resistance protein-like MFS transporter
LDSNIPNQEKAKDIYLNLSLWIIVIWQLTATINFTAVQLLLPLYLGDFLEIEMTIVGIIVSIFFLFWFVTSPIAGIMSDTFGRRIFLYLASIISACGQLGLTLFSDPISLLLTNAIVGFGSALGAGSAVALWVVNVPENRVAESMGYYNIILGIGGVLGAIGGAIMYENFIGNTFLIFAILRIITVLPIFYISEKQTYQTFTVKNILYTMKNRVYTKFYLSRDVLQVSIHWIAFSAVVGISGYTFSIVNRITGVDVPPTTTEMGVLIIGIPFVLLLPIWGWFADRCGNRPILAVGLSGTIIAAIYVFFLIRFGIAKSFILDALNMSRIDFIYPYLPVLIPLLFTILTAAAIIPSSMSWIVDRINEEDLAKVLSIRRALIGIGTVIGSFLAGITIGLFDVSTLFIVIAVLVIISAIILL